jgi:hypothetical protein
MTYAFFRSVPFVATMARFQRPNKKCIFLNP